MELLLLDANVLIDYCDADSSVLTEIRAAVGPIYVLSEVLLEVDQLEQDEALALGIQVIEPSFQSMTVAATQKGRLSFQDHLCLAVAREQELTCVTNDKVLRTHASATA